MVVAVKTRDGVNDFSKTVGQRVRTYRKRAGLSQEELAEKAGLHSTYISIVERGEKNVTLRIVYQISAALGVPLDELFANIRIKGDRHSVAKACYEIILSMPEGDQEAVYRILEEISVLRSAH
jgi:transcriptional regulator with XRE-family HTH domain